MQSNSYHSFKELEVYVTPNNHVILAMPNEEPDIVKPNHFNQEQLKLFKPSRKENFSKALKQCTKNKALSILIEQTYISQWQEI